MPKAPRRAAGHPPRHQPLEQSILLTATLCLLAAGAVMVYSASSARTLLAAHGSGAGTGYLVKYVGYGALGLVVMRVLSLRGSAILRKGMPALLAGSLLLVLAVKGVGVEVNGARRWLGVGPVQFQPSEVLKLALVLYACHALSARPESVRSLRGLRPLLVITALSCAAVALQPDLGTALLIGFTMIALLVAAGLPLRLLGVLMAVALVAVLAFALASPYRTHRLTSFLDPWAHAGSSGFQAVQGQIAIGSGGLFGVGPGRSVQKIFYLPEAHTDFILAVIGEELGVLGVTVLLFLYGLIAYAGLLAARRARDLYSRLLATGLTSMILCQATLNVFAVLGLAPLTGVPLPFVSYGSSNLVILLAAMGLLLNIAGGPKRLRAVASRDGAVGKAAGDAGRPEPRRWGGGPERDEDSDRRRRDRGTRRAGAGGRAGTAG